MAALALDSIVPIAIGAAAGVAEVTANQPLIYFKNCLQTGKKILLNPLVLYRGYLVNISSLAPITAFQVAVSGLIYKKFFHVDGQSPQLIHMAIASMTAGALSGIMSGPSETIILQQQSMAQSAVETFKRMTQKSGIRSVFRGTPFCMLRDGGFTAGFMALGPSFSEQLKTMGYGDVSSRLLGGIGAGLVASIVTHPFDTLKTRFQHDYEKIKYPTALHAIREGGLFKGLSARGLRVIVGTVIISNVTDILTKTYMNYKVQQQNTITTPIENTSVH